MSVDVLLSATGIGLSIPVLVAIRSRTLRVRLTAEAALVVAISILMLVQGVSPLSAGDMHASLLEGAWLRALTVVWWLIGARLVATLSVAILGRDARARQARLFSDLIAGGIYISAAVVVASSVLGLPVRGLVATSGVIAVVLGLAAQNALADIFSGIAVGVEQPFAVGDRVSVGEDVQGIAAEMNWRAVRLRTDGGDLVTVPNSAVAKARLVNHDRPTRGRSVSVRLPVCSRAPDENVATLLRHAVLLCPDIAVEPTPTIALTEVGVRSVWFNIDFNVVDSSHLAQARSQVLSQARRLLRHGGIGSGAHRGPADLIREMALFRRLEPAHIEELLRRLVPTDLPAGTSLFAEGSTGDELYVVRAGVLDVLRNDPAGRRSLGRIGPGGYLGVISMMTGKPRQASVEALTDVELLVLAKRDLADLLCSEPSLKAAIEQSVLHLTDLLADPITQAIEPTADHGVLSKLLDALVGDHRGGR